MVADWDMETRQRRRMGPAKTLDFGEEQESLIDRLNREQWGQTAARRRLHTLCTLGGHLGGSLRGLDRPLPCLDAGLRLATTTIALHQQGLHPQGARLVPVHGCGTSRRHFVDA
jgi:hypothetical protein